MNRYIIIHGHFYQPPRDNPWLGCIPYQPSASPYHDWNERVNAECYAPNSVSRILDHNGKILSLVNNYEKMSFNFGPTLLGWLRQNSPQVYTRIIRADTKSRVLNKGHGNAIAQCYNHMIMPLANRHDKITQIVWGIRDFQFHFGRSPEGMWLPETAVDLETLDIMAEMGISFTILAPHQAKMVKPKGEKRWYPTEPSKLDTSVPYLVKLPTGREIHIFFYNSDISHQVAFGRLLDSGEAFARKLLEEPLGSTQQAPIICIATDGETYGHHHKFSEMALSYAISLIDSTLDATITNPGYCLETIEPVMEVQIRENTSWSCIHGIQRWMSDCGCTAPHTKGWNQQWRTPLREALDYIRFYFIRVFEEMGRELFHDPWKARNEYVEVLLDNHRRDHFLKKHLIKPEHIPSRQASLRALELQKNAMFMYTSCGWFFNDISRIETIQILSYALRALELYQSLTGKSLLEDFLDILSEAKSNIKEKGSGADIFRNFVVPQSVDVKQTALIGAFNLVLSKEKQYTKGDIRIKIVDEKPIHPPDTKKYILEIFKPSILEVSRLEVETKGEPDLFNMEVKIKEQIYRIDNVIQTERQEIIKKELDRRLLKLSEKYEPLRSELNKLYRVFDDEAFEIPLNIKILFEAYLNTELIFAMKTRNSKVVESMLNMVKQHGFHLNPKEFEFVIRRFIEEQFSVATKMPPQKDIQLANRLLDICDLLPFGINLWTVQNMFYDMIAQKYRGRPLGKNIRRLGERLNFNMETILEQLNE